jgi:DNA adenine methylase
VCRWYNLPTRLEQAAERLRHVRIDNLDARELLARFSNRPATLVYLDPPYHAKRQHRYAVETGDEAFHKDLLKVCSKAKCMILISGYDSPLYDCWLCPAEGWRKTKIETHTRDTEGKDYARTEVLWSNRHFNEAKASGVVPIRLSNKEKANNKVNPPRRR